MQTYSIDEEEASAILIVFLGHTFNVILRTVTLTLPTREKYLLYFD